MTSSMWKVKTFSSQDEVPVLNIAPCINLKLLVQIQEVCQTVDSETWVAVRLGDERAEDI